MRRRRITNILILLTVGLIGVSVGLYTGTNMVVPHMQRAIDECVGEVEAGCPLLYQYALDLEEENARLNIVLRSILTDGDACPELETTSEGDEE